MSNNKVKESKKEHKKTRKIFKLMFDNDEEIDRNAGIMIYVLKLMK